MINCPDDARTNEESALACAGAKLELLEWAGQVGTCGFYWGGTLLGKDKYNSAAVLK